MKAERFDAIVKARAKARVDKKIAMFKTAVFDATRVLVLGNSPGGVLQGTALQKWARAPIEVLASNNVFEGWPVRLWKDEEKLVEKELLATMDEMSKALLAADKDEKPENSPAEEAGS